MSNDLEKQQNDGREDVIEGRNAVMEALRAGVNIDKVFIAKGDTDTTLRHIASTAREAGAAVVDADRRKLDSMSVTFSHQGVIAIAACAEYVSIGDILKIAEQRNEKPLLILCDEISDPHNLGAIIRTSEAAGAHGVIIPKRRSAGLNATVAKASSGAVYHTAIARVTNLTAAIKELKKAGVWVYAASQGGGTSLWESDLTGATALVIGSEGAGISRLVGENCDFTVSIPMRGKLSSLNASVSAAVLMYEAMRQREEAFE
jgi:23S rRNA (guanosine2251-2'-O)-methyltransferase